MIFTAGSLPALRGQGCRVARTGGTLAALVAAFLVVALATPALAAPKGNLISSAKPVQGGTVNAVTAGTWPTFDPASPKASVAGGSQWFAAIYDSMLYIGKDGTLTPGLVTRYTISPDKKIVILYLRSHVKFQDGTPFDATAVAWNLNRDRNLATGCTCSAFMTDITSVTAPSTYKVAIYLSQPFSPIFGLLATTAAAFMASPTAFQSEGETQFGQFPVGAGPYKLTQNSISVTLTLTAWPGYWEKGYPHITTLNFTNVANTSSAYATVESGGAQVDQNADPVSLGLSHSDPALKIVTSQTSATLQMQLNTLRSPFDNPIAREAVYDATDVQPIIQDVLAGLDYPDEDLIGPAMLYYPGGAKISGETFDSYNPTKAQQLVQQLGGLKFQIIAVSNSTTTVAEMEALQKEYDQVGMNVSIQVQIETASIAQVQSSNYDAFIGTFNYNIDPSLDFDDFFQSAGSLNHGVVNPYLDKLIAESQDTWVPAQRQKLINTVIKYVEGHNYSYPLWYGPAHAIVTTAIKNYTTTDIVYWKNIWLS